MSAHFRSTTPPETGSTRRLTSQLKDRDAAARRTIGKGRAAVARVSRRLAAAAQPAFPARPAVFAGVGGGRHLPCDAPGPLPSKDAGREHASGVPGEGRCGPGARDARGPAWHPVAHGRRRVRWRRRRCARRRSCPHRRIRSRRAPSRVAAVCGAGLAGRQQADGRDRARRSRPRPGAHCRGDQAAGADHDVVHDLCRGSGAADRGGAARLP